MIRVSADSKKIARRAKLKHVSDDLPGIIRKRNGQGFRYEYSTGKRVASERQLERIDQLAIPPAWSDVWICKAANSHLQATGRDDAGRKQYLYHDRWQETVSEDKFNHLLEFGKRLPFLRSKVQQAMRKSNPLSQRMLAVMIRILDETGIRIGNESYAKENGSYGLTTLLGKHVTLQKNSADLCFPGKSHQQQHVVIEDARVVRFLKSMKRKPKQPVFGYTENGTYHSIKAQEVNSFLQEMSGSDMSAKDFRTWIASARFAMHLAAELTLEKTTDKRRVLKQATESVAEFLGHTPTICKKYYLHPDLVSAYESGELSEMARSFRKRKSKWLRDEDQFLSHVLRKLATA